MKHSVELRGTVGIAPIHIHVVIRTKVNMKILISAALNITKSHDI